MRSLKIVSGAIVATCLLLLVFWLFRPAAPHSVSWEIREPEEILVEGQGFLQSFDGYHEISNTSLSQRIQNLDPVKVYTNEHGLWIVLEKRFVAERGLFIPRDSFESDFICVADPSCDLLIEGMYWFDLKS